jgi:GMP synthase-like glutamine amidotransferase
VFSGYDELASFSLGQPPQRDDYRAVMVFGGEANVDEGHDWLRREKGWIADLLERGTPLLGVCLGAQLIADVAGASVRRLEQPEIGWHEVVKVEDGSRFLAFEWHSYGFECPPGAVELARNDVGCQAFRLGNALGIQFHAEVDQATVEGWIDTYGSGEEALAAGVEPGLLVTETAREIERWNAFGRRLCERFLA